MSIVDRLDPALRHLAAARIDLAAETLPALRASLNQRRAEAKAGVDTTGVQITESTVDGVPVRLYRGGTAGTLLFCHSGAFVLGNLDTDHRWCIEMARSVGATVVSVDYRLAPEHPHPAAIDDASAVLRCLAEDHTRIAVAGNSAGGALAALLAQRSAAGELPPVVFQLLHQPVLDDRMTPSKEEFTDTPGFDGRAVALMWQYMSPHIAPARADELTGVAPALITCSELDPLRDEAVDYALRLMWAGVPAELHVYPGTCHGFDSFLPDWQVSRELFALQTAALRRAFAG